MRSHQWLFIVNPASNRGTAAQLIPHIQKALSDRSITCDFRQTERPGDATLIARQYARDYELIIAVGGDGTTHEVVNGLLHAKFGDGHGEAIGALGIVPVGSGNDFVKMIGIPSDPDAATEILLAGNTIRMDVGEIVVDNDHIRFFNNNIGIGFDAYVNNESLKIKYIRGFAMYLAAALKSIFAYKHPLIRYSNNGVFHEERILLVNTGNGACSGGGFYITPDAKINDGVLDVCVIKSMNKFEILTNLPKTMNGSHVGMDCVHMYKTHELTIESEDGLPIHADGEVVAMNARHIYIKVLPAALDVVVA